MTMRPSTKFVIHVGAAVSIVAFALAFLASFAVTLAMR